MLLQYVRINITVRTSRCRLFLLASRPQYKYAKKKYVRSSYGSLDNKQNQHLITSLSRGHQIVMELQPIQLDLTNCNGITARVSTSNELHVAVPQDADCSHWLICKI
jgi:hypothetical protein